MIVGRTQHALPVAGSGLGPISLSNVPRPRSAASDDRHVYALSRPGFELAVIDSRTLLRECLCGSLEQIQPELSIRSFDTLADLAAQEADDVRSLQIALYCIDWRKGKSAEIIGEITQTAASFPHIGLIIVADIDDISAISALISAGVRGYISHRDHLSVALQAMYLVRAGGVYVPANLVMWSSRSPANAPQRGSSRGDLELTPRQLSVADALRRGKSNKLIAYELNMCESTVKVHIRTIMKKLKAKNRTEAAYIINGFFGGDD
jgi:DNA-binding NarL/FixJ family response regulator